MRQFFLAIYALLLTFSLTACSANGNEPQSASPAESVFEEMPPEESSVNPPAEPAVDVPADTPSVISPAEHADNTPADTPSVISPAEHADSTQTDPPTPLTKRPAAEAAANEANAEEAEEESITQMNVQVGSITFTASLADTSAAEAFASLLQNAPVSMQMQDYAGFEKVGSLGMTLPASDYQTTAQPGDIVLYNNNQIVIFYGSNSWSYTRLGKINDLSNWSEALGSGDVTVTFSV